MSAWAACPTPFGSTCAVNGTDVCTMVGGTWVCDVSFSDDSAECTVVSDYDTATAYEAWGFVWVPGGGGLTKQNFCCASPVNPAPSAVHIEGSGYADLLQFTWDALTYNLTGLSGALTGTINGNDGADIINGSHADVLFGANPADQVECTDQVGTKWDGNSFTTSCNVTPNPTLAPGVRPAECP